MGFREKAKVMDSDQIDKALVRIAHEIAENNKDVGDLAIVGIRTRGALLAQRLAEKTRTIVKKDLPVGALDITLYRDDLTTIAVPASANIIAITAIIVFMHFPFHTRSHPSDQTGWTTSGHTSPVFCGLADEFNPLDLGRFSGRPLPSVMLTRLAVGLEPPSAPGTAVPFAPIRLREVFGSPAGPARRRTIKLQRTNR